MNRVEWKQAYRKYRIMQWSGIFDLSYIKFVAKFNQMLNGIDKLNAKVIMHKAYKQLTAVLQRGVN